MFSVSVLVFFILLSLFLLWRQGLVRSAYSFTAAAALLVIAFASRYLVFSHETYDYIDFLSKWIMHFRESGGFDGLGVEVGNYNVAYMVVLALLSYIDAPDLELIKLTSVFFDVWLAYFSMLVVSHFTDNITKRLASFFVILMLPTVFLNGALWAQCDSIYAAFAMAALWCALDDRPYLSVCAIAMSFAFKLQGIFMLALWAVLFLTGRIKIRHLLLFPVVYTATIMPAVIAGRPFFSTLLQYFTQAGTIGGGLNYNSPSMFALFPSDVPADKWGNIGIAAAFLLVAVVYAFALFRRKNFTKNTILITAMVLVVGIPFLLPHMHDRYFFLADVLSVCYAFSMRFRIHIPVLVSFASLLGYHAYLRGRYLLTMNYGAMALLIVVILLMLDFLFSAGKKREKKKINC